MTDASQQLAAQIAAKQQQLRAAQRLVAARQSRDSLLKFTKFTMPDPNDPDNMDASLYSDQAHHRLLCEMVEKVERGEELRVLISMPPQFGKSEITTRRGNAWMVGRKPWKNIMQGAYNQDFANEFGDDVRTIINSNEFKQVFPGVGLRMGSKAKDHMVTTAGGKISFLGRGGSGTGRPADHFGVDDPIKDSKEAESQTIRDDVWNWFTRVVHTRCHAASSIMVTQTRWSEDDIIGRLKDPNNPHYDPDEAKKWTYINIPAIIEGEELAKALGLKVGDSLWAERFSLEHLASARRLDPIGFSALYMGRPTPPEGAFFKLNEHIHFYRRDELPAQESCRFYGSGDLAVSPEKDADKSCVGNWGVDPDDCAWLWPELYWERRAADQTVDTILNYAQQFGWLTFFGERGVIDRSVGPFLRKRMAERVAAGNGIYFHIETFPVGGSKASRAISYRGRASLKKIRIPGFMPWSYALRDQMLKFTGTGDDREDDAVDMMGIFGQGLQMILKGRGQEQEPADPHNLVRVGSLQWIKHHAKLERERAAGRVGGLRGM